MSFEVLLSQNKILAYFTLDISANIQDVSIILQPSIYATLVFHNHYPVVYFEQLYEHFHNCLPEGTKPGNLRLYYNKKQLPSELPIGLFVKQSTANFVIGVELGVCLLDAFKIVKNSWKKAFEIINPNRKCDYVKSRLSKTQLLQKFRLYREGRSHNLQKEGLYEGANIVIKAFYEDIMIERKYSVTDYPTLRDIVKQIYSLTEEQIDKQQIEILSHTLPVNLKMSSKIFLDEWSYNDGYCYIVLNKRVKK